MFATRVITAVVAALLLAGASTCAAQVPQKMNYQVMLTDAADQPLTNQSVQMAFGLFDVSSGGSPLWTETHNAMTNSVGVVSVVLGETNPLTIAFDGPLWLQVEVDGEVLSPRRELVSAPYALTDEPGVASLTSSSGDFLSSSYSDVATRCLEAPADGYVLAIGTCRVDVEHTGADPIGITVGISDESLTLPANQQLGFFVPDTAGAGTFSQTVTVHGLFAVVGGQTECAYLVGRKHPDTGSAYAGDFQLTLLFVPTSYGTVQPTAGPDVTRTDASTNK